MSLCTILITKKSETEKVQEELKNFTDRILPLGRDVHTKYYSKNDFKNIPLCYNSFEEYDIIMLENYYSSFIDRSPYIQEIRDKKIKTFKKKGWNEEKIQKWTEEQLRKDDFQNTSSKNQKMREDFLFSLAQKYFVAFAYYMQGKEWNGFKESLIITSPQEHYEEKVIYILNEKMYKKILNAISYSL